MTEKKEKLRTTTITVDEEVWGILNGRKKLGRDSHNGVLRRLLGLDRRTEIKDE